MTNDQGYPIPEGSATPITKPQKGLGALIAEATIEKTRSDRAWEIYGNATLLHEGAAELLREIVDWRHEQNHIASDNRDFWVRVKTRDAKNRSLADRLWTAGQDLKLPDEKLTVLWELSKEGVRVSRSPADWKKRKDDLEWLMRKALVIKRHPDLVSAPAAAPIAAIEEVIKEAAEVALKVIEETTVEAAVRIHEAAANAPPTQDGEETAADEGPKAQPVWDAHHPEYEWVKRDGKTYPIPSSMGQFEVRAITEAAEKNELPITVRSLTLKVWRILGLDSTSKGKPKIKIKKHLPSNVLEDLIEYTPRKHGAYSKVNLHPRRS